MKLILRLFHGWINGGKPGSRSVVEGLGGDQGPLSLSHGLALWKWAAVAENSSFVYTWQV